jgi:hypothetical protein
MDQIELTLGDLFQQGSGQKPGGGTDSIGLLKKYIEKMVPVSSPERAIQGTICTRGHFAMAFPFYAIAPSSLSGLIR